MTFRSKRFLISSRYFQNYIRSVLLFEHTYRAGLGNILLAKNWPIGIVIAYLNKAGYLALLISSDFLELCHSSSTLYTSKDGIL